MAQFPVLLVVSNNRLRFEAEARASARADKD